MFVLAISSLSIEAPFKPSTIVELERPIWTKKLYPSIKNILRFKTSNSQSGNAQVKVLEGEIFFAINLGHCW